MVISWGVGLHWLACLVFVRPVLFVELVKYWNGTVHVYESVDQVSSGWCCEYHYIKNCLRPAKLANGLIMFCTRSSYHERYHVSQLDWNKFQITYNVTLILQSLIC